MKWWKDTMNTQARIGAALKNKRVDYNLTQSEIAKFIRCCQSAISCLESGKYGSLKLAEAYAWALGYELADIKFQGKPSMITKARSKKMLKNAKNSKVVSSHTWKVRAVG